MLRIKEAIVVEGRYDKAALASCVDAVILDTKGFGIFSDREKLAVLRALAEKRGLIVLTDSDGGGLVIRSFLKSAIDPNLVKHAYIPEITGKETRKSSPSKEGKLGVEAMGPEILLEALQRAGATMDGEVRNPAAELTKADLYAAHLTGRADSAKRRRALLERMGLPGSLTPNAMLSVLNALSTREEFLHLTGQNEG